MTHSEPSAIAAIAQQSTLSKKMPYIFADMIKLYDGTQLPYSTHIISPSLISNHYVNGKDQICLGINVLFILILTNS